MISLIMGGLGGCILILKLFKIANSLISGEAALEVLLPDMYTAEIM